MDLLDVPPEIRGQCVGFYAKRAFKCQRFARMLREEVFFQHPRAYEYVFAVLAPVVPVIVIHRRSVLYRVRRWALPRLLVELSNVLR